jgi:hypothetical protein
LKVPSERDPSRGAPVSENIVLLPQQSEGSIRLLDRSEQRRVIQREAAEAYRPIGARVIIAVLALVLGGASIWFSQIAPSRDAATAARR